MVSIIIPSYKDPLLNKTVESLLANAESEIEIICVMDGYWQAPVNDPRVKVVHLGKNRGMRGAINAGVAVSKGEYIMRTDEHCIFGKGYDRILTETCEDNWIVTAVRYFLDTKEWKIMDLKPIEHEKLVIQEGKKFAGQRWSSRDKEQKDIMISETMAMQGSMWLMKRSWWDKVIGELDTEGYGQLYQDSHEMVFKTWKAGGKLILNKNTWFAHKHRKFSRTHSNGTLENPSRNEECWAYSLKVWEDYYKEIKKKWKI